MNPTCIIISPYFPPSTLAGVHRARHLAKHLPSVGWTPIIVCVDEAFHEEPLDPELATLLESSLEVVKVRAWPQRVCRALGFGEISIRAWRPLRAAVMKLLQTRDIQAVMITGSPYYPMLLGAEIKRRFNVPVLLDFQDPWVSAWGATQPWFSKGGLAHRLASLLEPKAIAAADFITSVSDTQNNDMRARYPQLIARNMAAIPIGGDPADYGALATKAQKNSGFSLEDACFNLSYVGTIWPPVLETIHALMMAVAEVRSRRPDVYTRLRVNFIGTTENKEFSDRRWVRPIAEALSVADRVREETRRLPYLEALSLQAQSSAILLLGSTEPHYTASKIYGVMMSGRPYLSIFHRTSSSHQILSTAGGGIALSFGNPTELNSLVASIADAIIKLATSPKSFDCADPKSYEDFTAARITQRYATIFNQMINLNCKVA